MDATCAIQASIHVFSLVRKYVSRILGTYHFCAGVCAKMEVLIFYKTIECTLREHSIVINKNRILLRRILRLRRVAKRQILFRRSAIHAERFLLYRKCDAISYKVKKESIPVIGTNSIKPPLTAYHHMRSR